jgi:hypothetical protein
MYFQCYEHPRKRAAERILTRLVQSIEEDTCLASAGTGESVPSLR